ncbi:hypothetical protein EVAR_79660_1 [Eumeta japonica]|uniref:Uncharacterized protein n=1 Tax=Eumeta variegata TaxID=151549 RepID=A0A4C1W9U8_EUMVA|nr:hypothetical protein EVAR_79660_1 [Eumeta japonica]
MFDASKGAELVAPSLANSSCWASGRGWPATLPAAADVVKAFFIFTLSMAIVFGNLVLICVLNNKRYVKYIDNQVALGLSSPLTIRIPSTVNRIHVVQPVYFTRQPSRCAHA